jgi:amidohydrolase
VDDRRQAAKDRATEAVRAMADQLVEVSHSIWDHPELCYEEHHAHRVLTDALEAAGLAVEREAYDLPTAFVAHAGTEGPTVAICCEYDALPGIGHACGHNVIAAAGLGAGLVAAQLAEELGGRVRIVGTPAEEGGGGKVHLIDRGAFDDLDAAMMVHPADEDLDAFWAIAIHELACEFHGRPAHAAAAPHQGVNALDAAVLGYLGVAALRQHIEPHERIHGIFTHGGDKPNVVPAFAAMSWYIRSGTAASLERLKPRVVAALEAGAHATGSTFRHWWPNPAYDDLVPDERLTRQFAANVAPLGRRLRSRSERPEFLGSTDMGNVSHLVPSIHPMIAVAPRGVAIHTPDFADHARSPRGDQAVVDGAIGLACTAIDVWLDAAT